MCSSYAYLVYLPFFPTQYLFAHDKEQSLQTFPLSCMYSGHDSCGMPLDQIELNVESNAVEKEEDFVLSQCFHRLSCMKKTERKTE